MESFEQLSKQYEPMIHKIMRSLHIYKNEDEFYQLGLIGLWEAHERFDVQKGNFTNYAYTYIKGIFLNEMTKFNKYESRNVYPKEEFWDFIEDMQTEEPLSLNLLLSYCASLTENQTKWVIYTCIDDLTIKQIAEKEGVSISAVKAWRKGAKEKLKNRLRIV